MASPDTVSGLRAAAPPMMHRGEGLYVWDVQGRRYLDATSGGVWCVNVGYGRASIADAVRDQLVELNYFAGTPGQPGGGALRRGADREDAGHEPGVFLQLRLGSQREGLQDGAADRPLQVRRPQAQDPLPRARLPRHHHHLPEFHWQQERRMQYGPFTPGFVEFPHCCEYRSQFGPVDDYGARAARAMEEIILREGPDTIGAVVLEPITAGGGVITPPAGYLKAVKRSAASTTSSFTSMRWFAAWAAPASGSPTSTTASSRTSSPWPRAWRPGMPPSPAR